MSKTTKKLVEIVDDFNPQNVVNTAIGGLSDATGKINGTNTGYYKVTYENGKITTVEAIGGIELVDNGVVDIDKDGLITAQRKELTDKSAADVTGTVHDCFFHSSISGILLISGSVKISHSS